MGWEGAPAGSAGLFLEVLSFFLPTFIFRTPYSQSLAKKVRKIEN
jgi:hypothetical protein